MASEHPITEIGYDEPHTKLMIRFESGEEYVFVGVPAAVHRALREAPSLAEYVGERIMDSYPYNILSAL
ncbi:MAG: KTSC domain-containing protein [Alphaproteobacteria bacterium]